MNSVLPVCPRHPDVPAFINCQRCQQPVCVDCQRTAAVGVQCVDCVAASSRKLPRTRSVAGTPNTPGKPVVTWGIIALTLAVWVAQLIDDRVTTLLYMSPAALIDEPWRALTVMLVHSVPSPFHVGFNMYAVFIIGTYLEPLLGRLRFLALYLISGVGGSVLVMLLASFPATPTVAGYMASGWFTPAVGASGGVFGLFLAVVVLNRHLHRDISQMVVLILINGALGFIIPNIAWEAHLGGAIAGAAVAGAVIATRKMRSWQWPAIAGVAAVILAIWFWRIAVLVGG